jgi:hypothetical protein
VKASSPCYLEKTPLHPNGDPTQKCVCCRTSCEFEKMGGECQSFLRHWLDRPQGNSQIENTSSSTTTPPATPVPVPVPSTAGPRPIVATDTSTLSTTFSPHLPPSSHDITPITSDLIAQSSTTIQPDHSASANPFAETSLSKFSAQSSSGPGNGDSNNSDAPHTKRARSEVEQMGAGSDRLAKSARNGPTGVANLASVAPQESDPGPAYYILGLSAWLATVSEKEKASRVAIADALQRNKRQTATIGSMQTEKASLEEKVCELQDQQETPIRLAGSDTAKVRELQAECIQLRSDSASCKEEVNCLRAQLEQEVEKGRGVAEAIEDERTAHRLAIVGLESQVGEIPELRRQREATFKNADASRKQRNESQSALTTSQAENERLVTIIETMTAEHDATLIELDDARTGLRQSQALSVELETVKSELATIINEHQAVVTDNTRLSNDCEKMEEVKEKSRINQRLADDRLGERQEIETKLGQAEAEKKDFEIRTKLAEGQAEEIRKNWGIAKAELLAVHKSNRKLKAELKKHANCPGGNIVKRE